MHLLTACHTLIRRPRSLVENFEIEWTLSPAIDCIESVEGTWRGQMVIALAAGDALLGGARSGAALELESPPHGLFYPSVIGKQEQVGLALRVFALLFIEFMKRLPSPPLCGLTCMKVKGSHPPN